MRWNSQTTQYTALAVLFSLMILFPNQASSKTPDWNNEQDSMKSAIGLHYGNLAGHGVSFRVPLKWWLYAQIGGGIWHTSENERHNVGFELNYILRQDDKMRLFLGAGLGNFYHNELVGHSGDDEIWADDSNWNVGAGVGIEYLMGVRWAVQAEFDFAHTGENGDIKVAPQLGVHYYW